MSVLHSQIVTETICFYLNRGLRISLRLQEATSDRLRIKSQFTAPDGRKSYWRHSVFRSHLQALLHRRLKQLEQHNH